MSFLSAFGAYLPTRVVTNQEVAKIVGCDPDWIAAATGIEERRFADEESVADMAVAAAQDCLDRAGLHASTIGLVIAVSGSSERRFPGPASSVAARLGIAGVPAIDLPLASAGSLFGLSMAARLAASFGNILVAAAEKMSPITMQVPLDRDVAILFGDGAGACLVGDSGGMAVISDSLLFSDGNFSEDLNCEFNRPIEMRGRVIILQASRKLPSAILEILRRNEVGTDAVQTFLLHQANQNLTVRVARAIGVNQEKFYSNIRYFGNTSSASMLIAAAEWSSHGGPAKGAPIVFAAFGAGFHWGSLLAFGA